MENLFWGLDIDARGANQALKSFLGEIQKFDSAFGDFANEAGKAFTAVQHEVKALNHDLKTELVAGFAAVTAALKPVSREVDALGKDVNSFLRGITREAEKADKAMRQFGMNRADKAADNYAASIAKASANVEVLKQKLASANLEEKKKIELQAKIIEGEKQIAILTQRSTEHVTKARQAEEARAKAAADDLNHRQARELTEAGKAAFQDLGLIAGTASAAISAGIGGALKEFGDLEAQLIKFSAVSDATEAEMQAIEDQAMRLGASTKYTATEIAAAQVELAKMGFSAKETVSSMDAMVDAAIASGDGLDEVSSTIAETIRMFNMSASEAGKVSDIITRGANISAQSFKSYSDSMRYVGAAANGLNQPLETVATALNILADRGIKGTQAGEHLKIALQRLATQPKPAAEAISELNLAIADTKGTVDKSDDTFRNLFDIIKQVKAEFSAKGYNSIEQTNFLKKLFGAEAVASMRIFIDATEETIDTAIAKQAAYAGSTKETAEKMKQGWNHAVEEMSSAINGLQVAIGKELAPTLTMMAGAIEAIANGFNSLPGPIKSAIAHVGLFSAAILAGFAGTAGLSWVVTSGTKAVLDLDKALGSKLIPAIRGGNPALATMSQAVGILTKALGSMAAVAGTVYLAFKTNFGGMREIVDNFMDFLYDVGLQDWVNEWNESWASAGQGFQGVFHGMVDTMVGFLGFMDETTRSFFNMIGHISKAMRAAADRDWNWFKAEAENAAREAQSILSNLFNPNGASETVQNARREMAWKKFFGGAKPIEMPEKAVKPSRSNGSGSVSAGESPGGKTDVDKLDTALKAFIKGLENERKERDADIAEHKRPSGPTEQAFDPSLGGNITSGYGYRIHPVFGTRRMHTGVDSGLGYGAPIKSQSSGTVAIVNNVDRGGYGKYVIVDNGDGTYWLYGHASDVYAKVGQQVKKGDRLAAVGSTGTSTGPHLHTELRKARSGITDAGAFFSNANGAVPVDPRMGATGHASHDPESKKRASSVKYYQDLLAGLKRYEGAYIAAVARMTDADKKADAEGKLADIRGQISDARAELAELGADAQEAIRKGEQAALDESRKQLRDNLNEAENYFKDFVKKAEDAAEEGKKRFYSKLDTTDTDAVLKEFEEMTAWYEQSKQLVDDLAASVEEAKQHIGLMGPEERKELQDLIDMQKKAAEQAGRLKYQIDHLYGREGSPATTETRTLDGPVPVRVRINTPEVAGVAGKRAAQMAAADFDEANRKGQEFIKAIKGSEDAIKQLALVSTLALDAAGNPIHNLTLNMDEFAKSTNLSEEALNGLGLRLGKMNFDDFLYKLQAALPADAFNQLINTIESNVVMDKWERDMKFKGDKYKATVSAFTKALKEELEKAANAARRAKELWEDNLSQFSQIASLAFNDVINTLQNSGNEVGVILSDILNGTSEIGSGIARVFSGDIAGGAYQSITGFFNMFSRLMTRSIEQSKELIGIYNQLGKAVQDRQAVELQNQIEDARRKGLPTKGLEITQAQNNTQSAMAQAVSEFWGAPIQSGKSMLASMPKAANGKLDYEKIIGDAEAQYKRDSKGPRNLQDALSWAISGYNPLNYFLRVKALVENLKTLEAQGSGQVDEINARIDQASATLNENDQKLAQQGTLEANYTFAQSRKKSEAKNVEFLLDSYVGADPALREAMKSTAESLVSEQRAILDEVNAAFGHDPKKEAEEIAIRLGEFNKEIQSRLSKGVADFNKNASEKRAQEVDDEFKKRIEGLKKARTKLYEQETLEIKGLIKARQDDLAVIEEQNKALQRSIDLEEEKRRVNLKQFDAQDLTLFAQKKAGVNYDATIRQALDDIANPDGVLTDTFSSKSISEAIQAWVEQRSLENENAYGLEQYSSTSAEQNQLAYLARIQEIAAFQSRAAEEALKKEGLTTKQRNELTAMAREGYKSFQEANRKQIDLTADTQIQRINDVIQSNNQLATSISDQISGYQKELDSFTSAHEASLKEIDNRVNDIIDSQDEWLASAESLKDGIAKPLQDIIDLYNKVKSAAQSVAKDLSAPSGKSTSTDPNITLIDKVKNTGQSRAEMSARGYQVQGGDYWYKNSTDMQNDMIGLQAAKMATGGVVPSGYPNDTFPALLSSGESVLPIWFTDMLKRSSNLLLGGGGGVYNNQRANIEIHIHDAQNPMQIKQTILNTLKDAGISTNGSSVNGAYFGNLGMN